MLLAVVLVAGYGTLITAVGVQEVLDALSAASPGWLVVAAVLEVSRIGLLPFVHRASSRAVGNPVHYRQAMNVSMSMYTVTQTLPAGGAVAGVVGARRLSAFGMPAAAAAGAIALTGTILLTTVALLAMMGVAVAFFDAQVGPVAAGLMLALLVVLAGIVGVIFAVLRSRRASDVVMNVADKVLSPFPVDVDRWRETLESIDPPDWKSLLRILAPASANWLADIAALGFLFLALGDAVDLRVLLVGFGAAQFAALIPLSPGGLGLVEAGMAGGFLIFGVPGATATTVIILYRVLATWMPAAVGIPALMRSPT